jgi:NADPH:quinone reductase-like Zn-dependent oxidoreductase
MRAVVYEEYGGPEVLRMADVPKPVPREREVLVRIRACSLNGSDREGLVGSPAYARIGGWRRPGHPILGSDIAGVVEEVGKDHTEFKPGDEVFGEIPGYRNGLAEYTCLNTKTLARKPAELTFEQAAAIPQGGVIAYRGICTRGDVAAGYKVLINGAGGSAGVFAVQLAKLRGAEVTAVDHAHKHEFMRSLGADHVVDSDREDFTAMGTQYDLILDLIAHRSATAYARALRRGGRYFCAGGAARVLLGTLLLGPIISATQGKHVRVLMVPQNREDVIAVAEMCVQGKVVPVIDRTYALEEVRDAFARLVEGRALGKVVVRV